MIRTNTYLAQSDGRCCQADQSAIPCMGLMNGVGIVIAKLLKNSVYPSIVPRRHELPDHSLKASEVSQMSTSRREVMGEL